MHSATAFQLGCGLEFVFAFNKYGAELWVWMDISKSIFLFILVKDSFANPGCAVLWQPF